VISDMPSHRLSSPSLPADVANAIIVAAAVRFDIALFLGVGRYATDSAATLAALMPTIS
jgi:hypothetical protein